MGEYMSESKSRVIFGFFGLVGVMFISMLIFSFLLLRNFSTKSLDSISSSDQSVVGVVEVTGAIMESKKVIKKLLKAEEDESLKAIIVRIDSPGGAVGPTQEIYDEIVRIDQHKPVFASFGSVAASGGYYIGAAARKIYANKGTITGSIGVIMQFADLSKIYEFFKFKPEVIKSGIYKDIGSPNRPMTDKEKSLLNTTISKVHDQFREDILKRREGKIKGDLLSLSQGQIFSGQEALSNGLIDEIGGLWGLSKDIHEELKLGGNFRKLKFIKIKKDISFSTIMESLESPTSLASDFMYNFLRPAFLAI
jgi:protease IV